MSRDTERCPSHSLQTALFQRELELWAVSGAKLWAVSGAKLWAVS